MSCVKDAVDSGEASEGIVSPRRLLDAALRLLTEVHATEATLEPQRLRSPGIFRRRPESLQWELGFISRLVFRRRSRRCGGVCHGE